MKNLHPIASVLFALLLALSVSACGGGAGNDNDSVSDTDSKGNEIDVQVGGKNDAALSDIKGTPLVFNPNPVGDKLPPTGSNTAYLVLISTALGIVAARSKKGAGHTVSV
jgi:hypothetical protein